MIQQHYINKYYRIDNITIVKDFHYITSIINAIIWSTKSSRLLSIDIEYPNVITLSYVLNHYNFYTL